jgi:hypothetical protein
MKSWRQDDGTADQYHFTNDGVLSTDEYVHVAVDINPTGWNMHINGENVTGGNNGLPPTNDPIISDVSILRFGDAVSSPAAVDDVRIIKNYLNADAIKRLMASPVTRISRGTLNRLRIGELQPNKLYWGDDPIDAIYMGSTKVYGSDTGA